MGVWGNDVGEGVVGSLRRGRGEWKGGRGGGLRPRTWLPPEEDGEGEEEEDSGVEEEEVEEEEVEVRSSRMSPAAAEAAFFLPYLNLFLRRDFKKPPPALLLMPIPALFFSCLDKRSKPELLPATTSVSSSFSCSSSP